MKKQFINFKDFVHINLSRGEKSEVLNEDLVNAEKRVDLIKQTCSSTEKKILTCLQTSGSGVDTLSAEKRLKKMPQMQLYQSFTDLAEQLGTDSVLGLTLSECSKLQSLSAKELLNYEIDVEKQCLSALTKVLEVDVPIVSKAKKQLTKATTDMDNYRIKYQTALKLSQQNTGSAVSSAQKAESLKKEVEDSTVKVEQQRDVFAAEMFSLLSNESDYAHIFLDLFKIQANYHKRMQEVMEIYLPLIERVIKDNSQKPVFGTDLEEHLRVNKREISLVIETCIGWLLNNLNEEGLFRIPGSTSKVRKLKNAFDAGIVDIEEYSRDTHTIAGTLKSYLRELPEPLLTYNSYNDWISAAKVNDIDSRLQSLWKVCNSLPKANFDNLRYLIKFLAKLSTNSDSNKMSSQNLAIAIAPSLVWPQQESQPFDLNMTAANHHSLIVDALINYSDWFFPGDLNFTTFTIYGDRVSNGDNSYSGDQFGAKSQPILRSAKKQAPPVPPSVKPIERTGSLNDKYSSDSSEAESPANKEFTTPSLESNCENNSIETVDSKRSTNPSSVIYSTASLDRPMKRTSVADNSSDRPTVSDKRGPNVQLRNKVIEKPNVPPPSVPNRSSTERPQSVHERPSLPPPERPQRSCDNKAKERSLEALNDCNLIEKNSENELNSKSLYPSLNEFNSSDNSNESSNDSNDNSSVDSFKTKSLNDSIAFADDSDVEDNNNVSNNKYKIDSNYVQRVKQSIPHQNIPTKPPRAQSPANLIDKRDSNPLEDNNQNNSIVKTSESNNWTQISGSAVVTQSQSRPPRPLPPSKPRIHASTEDTHL